MDDSLRTIPAFRLDVYGPHGGPALNGYGGVGDEWRLRDTVSVHHRDESYSVSVVDLWLSLLASPDLQRIEREVVGRCTIVKWGDTMQLTATFRVVIELDELAP